MGAKRTRTIDELNNDIPKGSNLLAISYEPNIKKALFKCLACGDYKVINIHAVICFTTKSCGCQRLAHRTIHGLSKTHPLYKKWWAMKERCRNPKNEDYKHYGGRGIIVCKEWANDFMAFYNWSVANGWQPTLQIDRIDVNGNYEPSNCRYVTIKENNRNKRFQVLITYKNETMQICQWGERLNIKLPTLWARYYTGQNPENILRPLGVKKNKSHARSNTIQKD